MTSAATHKSWEENVAKRVIEVREEIHHSFTYVTSHRKTLAAREAYERRFEIEREQEQRRQEQEERRQLNVLLQKEREMNSRLRNLLTLFHRYELIEAPEYIVYKRLEQLPPAHMIETLESWIALITPIITAGEACIKMHRQEEERRQRRELLAQQHEEWLESFIDWPDRYLWEDWWARNYQVFSKNYLRPRRIARGYHDKDYRSTRWAKSRR